MIVRIESHAHPLVVEFGCALSQHRNESVAALPVGLDPVAVGAQGDQLDGAVTAAVGKLLDVVDLRSVAGHWRVLMYVLRPGDRQA